MSDTFTQEIEGRMAAMAARFKNRTPEEVEADKKREEEEDARRKQSDIQQLRYNWNAPERHLKCRPEVEGPWGEAFKKIESKLGNGCLFALVGGRGNGKTQMAVQLMKSSTRQLSTTLFCSAIGLFMEIKGTYKHDSSKSEEDIVDSHVKPALLVIDEIGKRGGTEWENNIIFELINRRYNEMKDTLLIDNRTKNEFIETIGPSLASRMNEGGGIIECGWESFRK